MKKYTVTITRTRISTIDVEIEANSELEAQDKVLEQTDELAPAFNECELSNPNDYEIQFIGEDDPYAGWESLVIASLAGLINCTYQDAQDIVEAQEFYMAQAWGKGLSTEATAKLIDEKSKA